MGNNNLYHMANTELIRLNLVLFHMFLVDRVLDNRYLIDSKNLRDKHRNKVQSHV